jgi:hypothetical protein
MRRNAKLRNHKTARQPESLLIAEKHDLRAAGQGR